MNTAQKIDQHQPLQADIKEQEGKVLDGSAVYQKPPEFQSFQPGIKTLQNVR
ncbi:hypothetical protein [Marinospirillum perlucidum]|uniref:hypothetical protein n=1 Tax=Marinospirillum perlucidum TaxID=1982602 RepID=UPI0013905846|nr:hypothetical protein [Marinospirillum perlucidum]